MKLSDVIELNELQQLCGSFTAMTGAATSFIDLDGKDLVASGNQNMCTLFHRENPRCALYCATARADLADRLRQGERYVVNQCPNRLFELAIALVVGDQPVASILVGPFLQGPPDVASFDRQAEEFGFDRSAYLASAKALPVFSEEKTETIADFLIQGAKIIGELGTTGMLLEERKAHVRFLENLELIDWTIKQETDIEKMLWHIVKTVFSIFGCDRAWLFYPCDPMAPTFRVPVEITRPEYPGACELNVDVPMPPDMAENLREALASEGPVVYVAGTSDPINKVTAEQFGVQSQMFMAIYPKVGKPWVFGMHQCSNPRVWTREECRLFQEIGGRLADGLSTQLMFHDLQQMNRELQAISTCNQILVRAVDEQTLLDDICRIVHEEAGYHLVWVGYVEHDDAKTLRPVAWAGHGSDYIANAKISWSADTERGQGPAGRAIRNGEIICVQDFATDPQMKPWREAAARQGYRSGIAMPLKDGSDQPFGVLLIYSSTPNAITPGELRLMEELAGDLAFGVTALRSRVERSRAEQALSESEAKMRSILDNVGIGVTLISPRMEILEMNRQMREWFPAIDPTEHPVCYHVFNDPPREDKCGYCPTFKTLRDGLVHEATTETPQAGGIRNYRIISSPVFDANGNVAGAIEMVEDITSRLSLESQFQQAQKMEAVGRLAGGVAHDFNNMLGVILGHVELAMEEVTPSTQIFAALLEIQKAATHSSSLTRQLLAFARKQTIAPQVLELNDTVAGMLSMLRRLIGENIQLEWNPDGKPCLVLMDPSQIDQILANLCVNARDAIAGIGQITVETTSVFLDETCCADHPGAIPGWYVRLTVSDNGCGMEQEILQNIFEPFFTTKGMGQGTGLGLSMVYGVVKQNQGFISVESAPGKGTTFQIFLLRYAGESSRVLMEAPARLVTGEQETILLVEDEPALLRLGRTMLQRLGYRVLAAGSPGEALRLAQIHTGEVDLLVTDVVMPEMTGWDLSLQLSSLYPSLKTLFMSGYAANVITEHGILDEGVCFVQKPFSKGELACKVREALGKPE